MEKNIDEDIKTLEELINNCEECKFATCEQCEINWTKVQAIKNVLNEVKEYKDIEQDYIANEEKLVDLISKLETELEKYKKITEKLAEYIEKAEIMHKAKIPLDRYNPDSLSIVRIAKKEEIIDWARKEVEK